MYFHPPHNILLLQKCMQTLMQFPSKFLGLIALFENKNSVKTMKKIFKHNWIIILNSINILKSICIPNEFLFFLRNILNTKEIEEEHLLLVFLQCFLMNSSFFFRFKTLVFQIISLSWKPPLNRFLSIPKYFWISKCV